MRLNKYRSRVKYGSRAFQFQHSNAESMGRIRTPNTHTRLLTFLVTYVYNTRALAHALGCCKIQTKIDFNRFSFFLGMYLNFFDRKILDVLTSKEKPLTLAELVRD